MHNLVNYFSKLLDREKLGRVDTHGGRLQKLMLSIPEDYKCLFRYGVVVWCETSWRFMENKVTNASRGHVEIVRNLSYTYLLRVRARVFEVCAQL